MPALLTLMQSAKHTASGDPWLIWAHLGVAVLISVVGGAIAVVQFVRWWRD